MPLIRADRHSRRRCVVIAGLDNDREAAGADTSRLSSSWKGSMIGVFAAADALLFYVLWEAMLIPMFLDHRHLGRRAARVRDHQVLPATRSSAPVLMLVALI